MGFDDGHQMMPPDGGAPVTSLDVAIGFVTEFNENTAIFAQVANMLIGFQLPLVPTNEFGLPIVTANYGPGIDPITGQPLQGPEEAPEPIDVIALKNQVNSMDQMLNTAKESAAEGVRRANTAQSTANAALAKALSAMSVAQQARSVARSAKSSAVADSDAETPPYVSNRGGPQ